MTSYSVMAAAVCCAMLMCLLASQLPVSAAYSKDLQYDGYFEGLPLYDEEPHELMEKRGESMRPVPFPCNGYDHSPRCLHGGKGPRKTWTKSGRFCVCLCPSKWVGPECGYAANSAGKRRTYWMDAEQGTNMDEKRGYPWKILRQRK